MTPKEWLNQNPTKGMNDYYEWLAENPQINQQEKNQNANITINQTLVKKRDNNKLVMIVGLISLIIYFLPVFDINLLGIKINTASLSSGFRVLSYLDFSFGDSILYILFYGIPLSSFFVFIGAAIRNSSLLGIGEVFHIIFVFTFCYLTYLVTQENPEFRIVPSLTFGTLLSFGCVLFFLFDIISDFFR